MDVGGHVGHVFQVANINKNNDMYASMQIYGDLRSRKTGQKTGCKTSEQKWCQKTENGSLGCQFWRLLDHFLASFLHVDFKLKKKTFDETGL